jgi:hypothetical protein
MTPQDTQLLQDFLNQLTRAQVRVAPYAMDAENADRLWDVALNLIA